MSSEFGCSPIVFLDEEKRKEWEEMDPEVKKTIMSMLHGATKKLTTDLSIELLCNVIIDMNERIEKLENKKMTKKQ